MLAAPLRGHVVPETPAANDGLPTPKYTSYDVAPGVAAHVNSLFTAIPVAPFNGYNRLTAAWDPEKLFERLSEAKLIKIDEGVKVHPAFEGFIV